MGSVVHKHMDMDENKVYPNLNADGPVISQPYAQPTGGATVIITQPHIELKPRRWDTGLFACIKNWKHCWCTLLCGFCYAGCRAKRMDESCCVGTCLGCAGLLAMRAKLRGKHNIEGGICDDMCTIIC